MGLQETESDNFEEQSENSTSLTGAKTINRDNLGNKEEAVNLTSAFVCNTQNQQLTTSIAKKSNTKMANVITNEIKTEIKSENLDEIDLLKQMEKLSVEEAKMNEVIEPNKSVLNNWKTRELDQDVDELSQNKEGKNPTLKMYFSTELKTNEPVNESIEIELSTLNLNDDYGLQQTAKRRLSSVNDTAETVKPEEPTCDDNDEEKESIPERGKQLNSQFNHHTTPYDSSRPPSMIANASCSSSSSQNADCIPKRYSHLSGGFCEAVNIPATAIQTDPQNRHQHANFHHLAVGIVQKNDIQQPFSQQTGTFQTPILNNINIPIVPLASQSSGTSQICGNINYLPPPSPAFSEDAGMTPGNLIRTPSINNFLPSKFVDIDNNINNNFLVPSRSFTERRSDDDLSIFSLSPASSMSFSPPSPPRIDSPASTDLVISTLNIRDRADSGSSEETSSSSDEDLSDMNLTEFSKLAKDLNLDIYNLPPELQTDLSEDINLDNNNNENRNDNEIERQAPAAVYIVISVQQNADDNSTTRQRQNSGNRFRTIAPKPSTHSTSATNAIIDVNASILHRQSYRESLLPLMKKDLLSRASVYVDSQPDSYFLSQDVSDTSRDTPIHTFMEEPIEYIFALVTRCYARNIPLDTRNAYAQTPLFYAVGKTNPDPKIVGFLVEMGADPAHVCSDGTTPLHIVAKRGDSHAEIARILCKACKAGDLDKKRDGCTPLIYALKYCETTCVKFVEILLSYGANINFETADGRDGRSALHLAVDKGDLELIRVICKTYPRINEVINTCSNTGETPLHVAARLNSRFSEEQQIAIIKLLFEYGAENRTDKHRNYPRNIVSPNRPKVVQLLKQKQR